MIPHILHQTWKSRHVPMRFRRFVASWRQHNRLEHRFYSDGDLRRLVASHFPQYLALYDGFACNLERTDFARYVMMYVEGGVYADLDMECLQPIDCLLESEGPVIGTEPREHIKLYRTDTLLCNAILLSPPGNPLWRELLAYIAAIYRPNGNVVYNTGPMALTTFRERRPELFTNAQITPPNVFYPLVDPRFGGKRQGRFANVSLDCNVDEAFTAHHWAHTCNTWFNRTRNRIRNHWLGRRKYFHESPAGNFDRRYYRRPLGDAEIRRELIATFTEYVRMMRNHRIDTWLMYGTLLGWYRGQGIIPWDKDIDMGVHYNDLYRIGQIDFHHSRYSLELNPNHTVRRFQPKNMVDARFIDRETGVFIDILGFHRSEDETFVEDKQRCRFRKNDIYPVTPCEFEGVPTLRPNNTLGVLHAQYGECLEPNHRWNGMAWEKIRPSISRKQESAVVFKRVNENEESGVALPDAEVLLRRRTATTAPAHAMNP